MKKKSILGYILLCSSILGGLPLRAQAPMDTTLQGKSRGGDSVKMLRPSHPAFLAGIAVSVDVLGLVQTVIASYGQYEAAVRLNLKQRFFPTFELGMGISDHTNDGTETHFETRSPYMRIGCDYNFIRNVHSGNRIFGGIRYAFTKATFDLSGLPLADPVWGGVTPYDIQGAKSQVQWMELVFGLETKLWKNIRLGWTARYRKRIHQTVPTIGQMWYVPGYGKNDGYVYGGTFNIVLEL